MYSKLKFYYLHKIHLSLLTFLFFILCIHIWQCKATAMASCSIQYIIGFYENLKGFCGCFMGCRTLILLTNHIEVFTTIIIFLTIQRVKGPRSCLMRQWRMDMWRQGTLKHSSLVWQDQVKATQLHYLWTRSHRPYAGAHLVLQGLLGQSQGPGLNGVVKSGSV